MSRVEVVLESRRFCIAQEMSRLTLSIKSGASRPDRAQLPTSRAEGLLHHFDRVALAIVDSAEAHN